MKALPYFIFLGATGLMLFLGLQASEQKSNSLEAQIEKAKKILREADYAVSDQWKPAPEHSEMTRDQWKERLSEEAYQVTQCSATEPPFRNRYWDHKGTGFYNSATGEHPLFHSTDKYKSGSGWPSFTKPVHPEAIALKADYSHGMERIEVVDAATGAHLGHLFLDGPPPTGLRFCINSAALDFEDQPEP